MAKIDLSEFISKMNDINKVLNSVHTEIAVIAVSFSKDRFRDQAWLDSTKSNWKKRKNRRIGGKSRSQTLLVDTGRLKRSVRKVYADKNIVIIGTDVPYAPIHNDGGTIKKTVNVKAHRVKAHVRRRQGRKTSVADHQVSAHTRKMNLTIPARKFLGNSATLERRIYLLITSKLRKAIKDDSSN